MNLFMTKETRLNIRIKPEFKNDLIQVAEYHGLTVSSYVHSVLVKAVRQVREGAPQAFQSLDLSKEKQSVPIIKQGAGANDRKGQDK